VLFVCCLTVGRGHLHSGAKFSKTQGWGVKLSAKVGARRFNFSVDARAKVGDKIYIGIRGGLTLHTHNSSAISYSDVSIHGASFMAITEFDGEGGHSYTNVSVRVRDVPADNASGALCASGQRLCHGVLASNADCFHSSGVKRGPRLRNVTLSSTFDDFLNIHTRTQLLAELGTGLHSVTILDPRLLRDKGLPNDGPYGTAETFQHVQPGDTLRFHQLNTLLPLASRPVLSTTRLINRTAALALAAQANIDLPKLQRGSSILPIDVCGLAGEPACALRAWQVGHAMIYLSKIIIV
jgi:hypothetical protein